MILNNFNCRGHDDQFCNKSPVIFYKYEAITGDYVYFGRCELHYLEPTKVYIIIPIDEAMCAEVIES
jgi:hypothetical protein